MYMSAWGPSTVKRASERLVEFQILCQAGFVCTLYLRLVFSGPRAGGPSNLFLPVAQKYLKLIQGALVSLLVCLLYFENINFFCITQFRNIIF
jgi:hypothetical protein